MSKGSEKTNLKEALKQNVRPLKSQASGNALATSGGKTHDLLDGSGGPFKIIIIFLPQKNTEIFRGSHLVSEAFLHECHMDDLNISSTSISRPH